MSGPVLKLVEAEPVVCWPWHLWFLIGRVGGHPRGARCAGCDRDVAVPAHNTNARAVCLYCAMDAGIIEQIDAPLGDPDEDESPAAGRKGG